MVISITFILLLIPHQPVFQCAFRLSGRILGNGPIGLMHITITKHLVETGKCLGSAGENHNTTHGTVQTMDYPQKHITWFLIFLLDIILHSIRERSIAGLVSLYDFSALLVYYDDMVIFVKYLHQ